MMSSQLPLALRLREGNTFDSFEPAGNEDLVAALRALAAGHARQVYFWGSGGSGRSHLLEATVAEAARQGRRACLLSGQELRQVPVAALDAMEQYDLLALDDLEALAGDPRWEEALFHLYNRCLAGDSSMVFAAAAAPQGLGLELADLASRLAAAGVWRVRIPDEEPLKRMLRRRAAARGLTVNSEVAGFIVMRSERSPAALMACLDHLDHRALAEKRRLTVPFVKQTLGW